MNLQVDYARTGSIDTFSSQRENVRLTRKNCKVILICQRKKSNFKV